MPIYRDEAVNDEEEDEENEKEDDSDNLYDSDMDSGTEQPNDTRATYIAAAMRTCF